MIASQVLEYPDIVRRIVEEGHEIGVHTYTHPQFTDIIALRLRLILATFFGFSDFDNRSLPSCDFTKIRRAGRVFIDAGPLIVMSNISSKSLSGMGLSVQAE